MTCAHVLDLIDAGPFASYSKDHMTAAWDHARRCAACGRAMQMSGRIADELIGMAEPAANVDFSDGVLARIGQIEHARRASATADGSDVPALAIAASTIVVAVAAILSIQPGNAPWSDLLPAPDTAAAAVMLVAALILYATGLFAPLGTTKDGEAR